MTTSTSWPYADSASRYGTVSRVLHWAMALCFVVVFAAALVHFFLPDTAVEEAIWPLHKPTGALLLALVIVRTAWALSRRSRPVSSSAAARWGHLGLYLLMWAVPVIALIRQYGSGSAFSPFGVPLIDARTNDRISWMTDLGGLLHGELGWLLFAASLGHIAMAWWHRRRPETNVLPRMWG